MPEHNDSDPSTIDSISELDKILVSDSGLK